MNIVLEKIKYRKVRYEMRFKLRKAYGIKLYPKYKNNFKMLFLLELIREIKFKAFVWKAKKHRISYLYFPG